MNAIVRAVLLSWMLLAFSGCGFGAQAEMAVDVEGCNPDSHQLGRAILLELRVVGDFDAAALSDAMFESQPKYRFVHTEMSGVCESSIIGWNEEMRIPNPDPETNGVDDLILLRFVDAPRASREFDNLLTTENASDEVFYEQLDTRTWRAVRGFPGRNAALLGECLVGLVENTTDNDRYISSTRNLLDALAARLC